MTEDRSIALRLFAFLVLTFLFFIITGHDYSFSSRDYFDHLGEEVETMREEGNPIRRAGLAAFGAFSVVIFLLRKGYRNFSKPGLLGKLILFFLLFSVASVIWSIDQPLTLRRLMVFAVFWFSAAVFASSYHIDNLAYFTLFSSALFLAIGLSCEILLGDFHPLSGNYRFSGTVHPNVQGVNCALLLLSASAIIFTGKNRRFPYVIIAILALAALILTKSRTSFMSALLSLVVLFLISSTMTSGKINIMLALAFMFLFTIFFSINYYGYDSSFVSSGFHLGRDSADVETLNGRIRVWASCLGYFIDRPIFGHGYDGFWNLNHISQLSNPLGWGVKSAHSTYIDLLLNLGVIGAFTFYTTLAISIRKTYQIINKEVIIGHGFLFVLLLFFAFHGFLESSLARCSYGTFLTMWGLSHLAFVKSGARTEESE